MTWRWGSGSSLQPFDELAVRSTAKDFSEGVTFSAKKKVM
jgi:hypothetical protein